MLFGGNLVAIGFFHMQAEYVDCYLIPKTGIDLFLHSHCLIFCDTRGTASLYLALGNINTSVPYQTAGEELKARSIQ